MHQACKVRNTHDAWCWLAGQARQARAGWEILSFLHGAGRYPRTGPNCPRPDPCALLATGSGCCAAEKSQKKQAAKTALPSLAGFPLPHAFWPPWSQLSRFPESRRNRPKPCLTTRGGSQARFRMRMPARGLLLRTCTGTGVSCPAQHSATQHSSTHTGRTRGAQSKTPHTQAAQRFSRFALTAKLSPKRERATRSPPRIPGESFSKNTRQLPVAHRTTEDPPAKEDKRQTANSIRVIVRHAPSTETSEERTTQGGTVRFNVDIRGWLFAYCVLCAKRSMTAAQNATS